MAPLEVGAEVGKSALKLIYKPQKNPINPHLKLMKSLGVEGRSAGVCAGIYACERACVLDILVWRWEEGD